MSLLLTPHTAEWFAALDAFDPAQAAVTRQVLKLAGSMEACGSCGDRGAFDYRVIPKDFTVHSASTMRLCDTCRDLRAAVIKESHVLLRAND